jgi:hypothetical protein
MIFKLGRIVLGIGTAAICLCILFYGFINIYGKSILTRKLSHIFGREVSLGGMSVSFPADLKVKRVEVKGLLSIDEFDMGGGVFDLFRVNAFRVSTLKVIRPVVTVDQGFFKAIAETVIVPAMKTRDASYLPEKMAGASANPKTLFWGSPLFPKCYADSFILRDGVIRFIDYKPDGRVSIVEIRDVMIKVDVQGPGQVHSGASIFELSGKIPAPQEKEEGKIEARGSVDAVKRKLDTTLRIEKMDLAYLSPYYSRWFNLEKAGLINAKLSITSEISGFESDLNAKCRLALTDIMRGPLSAAKPQEMSGKITDVILKLLHSSKEEAVVLYITIQSEPGENKTHIEITTTPPDEKKDAL